MEPSDHFTPTIAKVVAEKKEHAQVLITELVINVIPLL
jgi:hypothetical protein